MEYQRIDTDGRRRRSPAVRQHVPHSGTRQENAVGAASELGSYRWWLLGIPLLFVYIYAPASTHLPFGFVKFLVAASWFLIVTKYRVDLLLLLRHPLMKWGIVGLFLSLIYMLFIGANQPQRFRFPYRITLLFIEVFPVAYVSARFIVKKHRNPVEAVLLLLYFVALAQGVLAICLFLMPDINTMLQQAILGFSPDDKIFTFSTRGFGVGGGYLYSLPLFQGLAACCAIHLGVLYRKWWLILGTPIIIAGIVLNARIGLFVPLAYFPIIAGRAIIRGDIAVLARLIMVLFGASLIGAIALLFVKSADVENTSRVMEWVEVAFVQIFERETFYGNSTIDVLLDMVFFPPNLLIGTGIYAFDNPVAPKASDLGFIVHLYYGGIILVSILYSGIISFFLLGYRVASKAYTKLLFPVLIGAMVLGNMKGDVVNSNDLTRAAFLILAVVLVSHGSRSGAMPHRQPVSRAR